MSTPEHQPGDVVNGHVLGDDNQWHPVQSEPGTEKPRMSKRTKIILATVAAVFVLVGISSLVESEDTEPVAEETVAEQESDTLTDVSAEDVFAAFEAAGLAVPNIRDNSNNGLCADAFGCDQLLTSDTVSVYVFPSPEAAEETTFDYVNETVALRFTESEVPVEDQDPYIDALDALIAGETPTPAPSTMGPEPQPSPEKTSAPPAAKLPTAKVTGIVDGDTIDTTAGRIRIIGIDTPERGECNFDKATELAAELLPIGATVELERVKTMDNTDRYGRLIRYVYGPEDDVGKDMIASGLAVARYDSRDGYGAHPREDYYHKLDDKSPAPDCYTPEPEPEAESGSSGGGSTYYENCDAARAAGAAPVYEGQPGYGSHLDRDGNGVGCE